MKHRILTLCAFALAITLGLGASPVHADVFDQQPAAGALTDGVWATKVNRGGSEYVLAMRFSANGQFAMATLQGKTVVSRNKGNYRAENGRMAIQLANGQTGNYQFRIDGDRLTLVSATGKMVFQRIRKKTPAKPVKKPEIKKSVLPVQIQGTWLVQGNGGRIITRIRGNSIDLKVIDNNGKVLAHMAGTYTIQGDKLIVVLTNGERGVVPFKLNGNRLTLVIDGKTFTMTRQTAQPKHDGIEGFPSIS